MKNIYLLLLALLPFAATAQEVYHIKFSDSNALYSIAVIIHADDTGLVRVKYIDADCDVEMVEMEAHINTTMSGYAINCTNPVYAGTTKKAKNYNPDTFYITQTPNDGWVCKNIDSAKNVTNCSIMEVTGTTNQDIFLQEFDWEFTK
jgi:hypothetical protein